MSLARTALVTCCGLGLLKPAPGTWGSLPPVVVCVACLALGLPDTFINAALVGMGVIACAACLEFGAWAEKNFGRKDARQIVADEVAGQSVALLMLPWREGQTLQDWEWNIALAVSAFLFFRIADIFKPPPARDLQELPGGMGVLIDDIIAGGYALIAMQAVSRIALLPVFESLGA